MSKCKFCGTELDANAKFCSGCGAKIQGSPVIDLNSESGRTNASATSSHPKRRAIKGGMLAWSVVNAAFGLFGTCACLPLVSAILGVVAIIMVILAQDAKTDELEKSKIRTASVLNIIASVLLVVSIVLAVVLITMGIFSYTPYSNTPFNIDDFMQMYPYLD